jgi:hypothetical protein
MVIATPFDVIGKKEVLAWHIEGVLVCLMSRNPSCGGAGKPVIALRTLRVHWRFPEAA